MDKLKIIDTKGITDITEIFNTCYEHFKNEILNGKARPMLGSRSIRVPTNYWIENKAEIFWHAASIEQHPELSILPCNNDIASSICSSNCITAKDSVIMQNGKKREKCVYRAARVSWIREVIDLYNSGDPRVKYWEKINSKKARRIYLRYQEEELDYIVVLEHKSEKRVVLITGYPVFFISAKNDYDTDYSTYQKTINQSKK